MFPSHCAVYCVEAGTSRVIMCEWGIRSDNGNGKEERARRSRGHWVRTKIQDPPPCLEWLLYHSISLYQLDSHSTKLTASRRLRPPPFVSLAPYSLPPSLPLEATLSWSSSSPLAFNPQTAHLLPSGGNPSSKRSLTCSSQIQPNPAYNRLVTDIPERSQHFSARLALVQPDGPNGASQSTLPLSSNKRKTSDGRDKVVIWHEMPPT